MHKLGFLGTLVAVLLAVTPMAAGQAFVQQGNVLDANPRVGSGGLNYGARRYDVNLGNQIVTGNVAGGLGFRGFSPVRDPSSLFFTNYSSPFYGGTGLLGVYAPYSGLPSDRLTVFNRESVSVSALRQGYTPGRLRPTPYYSPSSTVADTGALIAGLNRPGSSQLASPYSPARPDLRIVPKNPLETAAPAAGSLLSVAPRLVRIDTGQALAGPVNSRLMSSRLFGAVREVPVEFLAAQAERYSGGALAVPPPQDVAPEPPEPRGAPGQQPAPEGPEAPVSEEQGAVRLRMPSEASSLAAAGPNSMLRGTAGPLARGLPGTPDRMTQAQAEARAGARPGAGPPLSEAEFTGPIRSFVGTQATAFNQQLDQAEDLLKQGQFYRAAETYTVAQTIDPDNPLPLLGRSVALLAAGDYMSSANSLFTAIRLFESRVALQVDWSALVPAENLLAQRRADLEKRLQVFDDFRLRFLLGYLQFSTGQVNAGLFNMERAAANAPVELESVRRFVAQLKEKFSAGPETRPAK